MTVFDAVHETCREMKASAASLRVMARHANYVGGFSPMYDDLINQAFRLEVQARTLLAAYTTELDEEHRKAREAIATTFSAILNAALPEAK